MKKDEKVSLLCIRCPGLRIQAKKGENCLNE